MDRIAVNTGELQQATNRLQELLQSVRNELSRMYEAEQQLDSMWDGAANAAFRNQFAQDGAAASDLCDTLGQFLQSMEFARETYDACESCVCDLVASIRI